MFKRIKFLLLQLFVWLCFFELARIVFLLYNYSLAIQLPFKIILGTFIHGLRMDLSMACYIIILPCLFVLFSVFIPFFKKPLFIKSLPALYYSYFLSLYSQTLKFIQNGDIGWIQHCFNTCHLQKKYLPLPNTCL